RLSSREQFPGTVHLMLGEIYWKNGQSDMAMDEYRAMLLRSENLLKKHPELAIINNEEAETGEMLKKFRHLLDSLGLNPFTLTVSQAMNNDLSTEH
ncbi:hypothetical protein, partial [Desulfonatronospira sp.]|uniref:hypothetical protein n=1 Tax=Desulfonatronospira sp. TaxID=1962951 RepID=UPI0025BE614E